MKLEHLASIELINDDRETLLAKLLAAHNIVRDVNAELKADRDIKALQKRIDELKKPYKLRLLEAQGIIASATLVARAKGWLSVKRGEEIDADNK